MLNVINLCNLLLKYYLNKATMCVLTGETCAGSWRHHLHISDKIPPDSRDRYRIIRLPLGYIST